MATLTSSTAITHSYNQVAGASLPSGPNGPPLTGPSISKQFRVGTSGVLADQCDTAYCQVLSLVAATPQALDLTTLVDIFGAAISFAKIKKITIIPVPTVVPVVDGATLKLGYSTTTSNAWVSFLPSGGQLTIQASPTATNDAIFVVTAPNLTGYAVSSSNKLFNFLGSVNMNVTVIIEGTSV